MKHHKRLHIVFNTAVLLTMVFLLSFCELILPNKPPFVEFLSPTSETITLKTDQTISLVMNAYDVDGKITNVQFKIAEQLLGSDDTEPYEFTLNGGIFSPGNYEIDVVAVDNDETIYLISKAIVVLGVGIVSAGDDVTLTNGVNSYVLSAQKPEGSTGVWTTVPEGIGAFSNSTSPTALFTGTLCNVYTLKWTVSNGLEVTSDEVTVNFTHTPTAASAGDDAHFSDGTISTNLDANVPDQGTGLWTIVTGEGGVFTDNEDPKTEFSGDACEEYVLQWAISTSCESSTDQVSVRFDNVIMQADAGPDQSITDGTIATTLAGNDPGSFIAEWIIISGENGTITDPTNSISGFSGQVCEIYVLKYSITSGCGVSEDEVIISFSQELSEASAGEDLEFYDGRTSTFLAAIEPVSGDGQWTIISGSGGQVDDPTDYKSNFIGLLCETYILEWTISTNCGASTDDVTISFQHAPSEAYAGNDQFLNSGVLTTLLNANVPADGVGAWTITSGPGGTFVDPTNPATSFTGQLCGTYVLQWAISTSCSETTDQVTIVFDQIDIPAYAGLDMSYLDGTTTTTLNANDPNPIVGVWSIISGNSGIVSEPNNPTSSFSGQVGQVYVVQWTITSACGTNSDKVKVSFLSTGLFTDTRDGAQYPTVTVGGQEWMAKNMNVKTVNYSWPYADQDENRADYGLLYNYEAALVACPTGWHLPTDTEWRTLEITLGMSSDVSVMYGYRGTTEGAELKEKGTSHWATPNSDAVDLVGFMALPAGYRSKDGTYGLMGTMAAFWTATQESSGDRAVYRGLHKDKEDLGRDWFNKENAISVRCVRD